MQHDTAFEGWLRRVMSMSPPSVLSESEAHLQGEDVRQLSEAVAEAGKEARAEQEQSWAAVVDAAMAKERGK